MSSCARCGHELGVGRFCTNCGAPVGEDTARARGRPEEPAEAGPAPPPVPGPERHRHRATGTLPWLLGFAALATVAALGAWLLTANGPDPTTATQEMPGPERSESPAPTTPTPAEASPSESPEEPATRAPRPTDLAGSATVSAPRPAASSTDTDGDVVEYEADNLLDADPTTAWRMRGDGTGETITFRFDTPVRLRQVGLINGYAKTGSGPDGAIDWYAGNRRIRAVEWSFDAGTVLTQQLESTRRLQSRRVPGVRTRTVTLRLVEVTAPGPGRTSRNYTAISGVRLLGTRS